MKKNRTREERALRYAGGAAAADGAAVDRGATAVPIGAGVPGDGRGGRGGGDRPGGHMAAAVGAGWLTWRGMALVLKLDEPRRKRTRRR